MLLHKCILLKFDHKAVFESYPPHLTWIRGASGEDWGESCNWFTKVVYKKKKIPFLTL